MKTYYLDTNVLLRYILDDIPAQTKKADTYFNLAESGNILLIVAPIVIFEMIYVLYKTLGFNRKEVVDRVRMVMDVVCLKFEEKEILYESLETFLVLNVDMADAYLRSKASSVGAGVISFDRDFTKLSKEL